MAPSAPTDYHPVVLDRPGLQALIDVLVVGAIAGYAAERVPAIYETLGDAAAAERARAETARLAAPIREWKARRKASRL